MADFTIELTGEQFKRSYLLYIIEIRHKKDRYYYVGQTGDNNYVTARPAFRRLSGHLEDSGNSTQNQIYRYIACNILCYGEANKKGNFSNTIKQAVEDFLVDSSMLMYVYKVLPFRHDVSEQEHRQNRSNIQILERHLIKAFIDAGRSIGNKSIIKTLEPCPYPTLFEKIKIEFNL